MSTSRTLTFYSGVKKMCWFLKASFFMGDSEVSPLGFGREIVKNISILAHLIDIFFSFTR